MWRNRPRPLTRLRPWRRSAHRPAGRCAGTPRREEPNQRPFARDEDHVLRAEHLGCVIAKVPDDHVATFQVAEGLCSAAKWSYDAQKDDDLAGARGAGRYQDTLAASSRPASVRGDRGHSARIYKRSHVYWPALAACDAQRRAQFLMRVPAGERSTALLAHQAIQPIALDASHPRRGRPRCGVEPAQQRRK